MVKYYWSSTPGQFVNKLTGIRTAPVSPARGPSWTGKPEHWLSTLQEIIYDVQRQLTKNFAQGTIYASPAVLKIFKNCSQYTSAGSGQLSTGVIAGKFSFDDSSLDVLCSTQNGAIVELNVNDEFGTLQTGTVEVLDLK